MTRQLSTSPNQVEIWHDRQLSTSPNKGEIWHHRQLSTSPNEGEIWHVNYLPARMKWNLSKFSLFVQRQKASSVCIFKTRTKE